MNCANHPELTATAFCRDCGKPMCTACQRPALGSIYCAEHVPEPAAAAYTEPRYTPPPPPPPPSASPYTAPAGTVYAVPDPSVHPILALLLGLLPGVGAIYNGQYAKGLIHAVIFGLLVSIESGNHSGSVHAFTGIMIAAWVVYQAFEAYHTARKRRYGFEIEEFSSLIDTPSSSHRFPLGGLLLIGIGFLLLLETTNIIDVYRLEQFWPAGLILIGAYMLYARLHPSDSRSRGERAEVRR